MPEPISITTSTPTPTPTSMTIEAIYRYPIKGFSPQHLKSVAVSKGKPLQWDRAFAIENGPSGFDQDAPSHLGKIHFLMLMKQPELAALKTEFDPQSGAFSLREKGDTLATGNLFEPDSMQSALTIMADKCQKPLRGEPRLLHANGHAFTDSRTQDLTLINQASVSDLADKIGAGIEPLRFRGNVYLQGAEPWQEHDWVGKTIKIGAIAFQVRKRTERCAATMANPETGARDLNIPQQLMKLYGHTDCGIHLMPISSGTLQIGDRLFAPE